MKGQPSLAASVLVLAILAPPVFAEASSPSDRPADAATSASQTVSPADEFARLLDEAQKAYTRVNDYVSTLVVQERIEGELRPRATGLFKFRKPFAVYIKWREGPQVGTQILYVRGQNEGKVLARKAGLAGLVTFRLDPTSKLAMSDNRHPITESGIGVILDVIESNRKRAVAEGCARVRRLADNPRVEPRGLRYELLVEAEEKAGYYCRRAVVTMDPKTQLPIAVLVFNWENRMVEDYRYLDVQLNVGLTDRDFDPRNPEYGF